MNSGGMSGVPGLRSKTNSVKLAVGTPHRNQLLYPFLAAITLMHEAKTPTIHIDMLEDHFVVSPHLCIL